MQKDGQVFWSKEQNQDRECKTERYCEQKQRAEQNREYVEQRSLELARELANWRDWIDLVRTLQH